MGNRGRPKGSKNKKTLLEAGIPAKADVILQGGDIISSEPIKRGRGRPKKVIIAGDVHLTKDIPAVSNLSKAEKKDLKKKYRELRRLKKGLKPGSPERIDIGRKMKEIKDKLAGQVVNTQVETISEKTFICERDRLVEEIMVEMRRVNCNVQENFWKRFWSKPCFTEDNLKEHLDIWKKKGL
jgi:hypothetical protein